MDAWHRIAMLMCGLTTAWASAQESPRAAALRQQAAALAADADPRLVAKARLRSFTAELLQRGAAAGAAQHWLIGVTLDRDLDAIDAAIDALPDGETSAPLLAADLAAGSAALSNLAADPWPIARDALATLSRRRAESAAGWILLTPAPPEPAQAFRRELERLALTDPDDLASLVERAFVDPAYAPSALALVQHVRAVAADQPPRGPVAQALAESLAAVARSDRAGPALLQSQGAWSSVLAAARRVEARGNASEQVRLEAALRTPRAGVAPADAALWRDLIDLATVPPSASEDVWPRPMRPLARAVLPVELQTRERLVAVLPEALRAGTPPTDPGVLAAVAARRAALDELDLYYRGSLALAPDDAQAEGEAREPVRDIAPAWQRHAQRLQRLAQDLPRADRAVAAGKEARALLRQARDLARTPAEEALGRAVAEPTTAPLRQGFDALTAGRTAALRADMLRRRQACLEAIRRNQPVPEADAEALEAAATLSITLADVAWIAAPARSPAVEALHHLAAVELSEPTRRRVVDALLKRTAEATRLVLEGDPAAARAAAETLRDDAATARLLGRLARLAQDRAAPRTQNALAEVALGGPRVGAHWLADRAEELASLSRSLDAGTPVPPELLAKLLRAIQ